MIFQCAFKSVQHPFIHSLTLRERPGAFLLHKKRTRLVMTRNWCSQNQSPSLETCQKWKTTKITIDNTKSRVGSSFTKSAHTAILPNYHLDALSNRHIECENSTETDIKTNELENYNRSPVLERSI